MGRLASFLASDELEPSCRLCCGSGTSDGSGSGSGSIFGGGDVEGYGGTPVFFRSSPNSYTLKLLMAGTHSGRGSADGSGTSSVLCANFGFHIMRY